MKRILILAFFLFFFCVITVSCDSSPKEESTKTSTSYSYILNTNSKVAHRNPGCSAVKRMSSKNKQYSNTIPSGYSKCKNCFH